MFGSETPFSSCVNQPFETFLVVQEKARILMVSRCLSAGLAIGGLLLLGPAYGLLGGAIALLVAQTCNLAALWWLSQQQLRVPRFQQEEAAMTA